MSRPRYVRHRKFNRLQHSVQFLAWLDVQAVRLDTTAKVVFEELMVAFRMSFEQVEAAEELVAPENLTAPVVTGDLIVGRTLSATLGTWDGFPVPAVTLQWFRVEDSEGVEIEGATGASYTLTEDDEGCKIYVEATATNFLDSDSKESDETDIVLAPAAPTNEAVPSITGTAKAGEVLTVVPGEWIGVPEPVLSYVWVRNDGETDTVIEGATEVTYTLTEEDVGLQIFVRETATNDSGSDCKESQATAVVEAADEGEE